LIRYHLSKPDTLINLPSHYYVVAFNKTLLVLVAYAVVSIVDITLTYYYVVYVGGFIELNPLVAKYMLSNPLLWFTLDFGGFTLMVTILPRLFQKLALKLPVGSGRVSHITRFLRDRGNLVVLLGVSGIAVKLSVLIRNILEVF